MFARKIVDVPAFDCTRGWRSWQAEEDQIEKLEETEREFGIQRKMLSALIKSRLYGGAAIVLGVNQGTFQDELDVERVKKGDLKFVHVVQRYMLQAITTAPTCRCRRRWAGSSRRSRWRPSSGRKRVRQHATDE